MIGNPYEAIPYKQEAWAEGFCKGLAAIVSPTPSDAIYSEDYDAFNDGVAVGADIAAYGLPFDWPCVAALEGNPGHDVGMLIDGAHLLHAGWEVYVKIIAGAVASLLVVVVNIGASANYAVPAADVLPQLGQEITEKLASFGVGSLEFFAGVSLDLLSHDCTMLLTPLYMSLDQARDAAIAAGGPDGWFVISWRTDQSNSFRIVTSSDVE